MKRILFWLLPALVVFFFACNKTNDVHPRTGGDTDSSGNNTGGLAYNKADTTVSLQDGRISLHIPTGAMKEGTAISMAASNEAFVDTSAVLHEFQLLPEGTKFSKDITVTFHYDSSWLQGSSPWNVGIAYKDDADGKWYPAVNGIVDTVAHTLTIKTPHFSKWCIYTCFHLYMKMNDQLSEDGSRTINMHTSDDGLLLCTMDEPPLWMNDPDKGKNFTDPLIAPLVKPQITPKEQYQNSLVPDEWAVNGVSNGDDHLGIILPVSGATEKLYQYIAPASVPENNPVAISATIRTKDHGDILLIQPVNILGNWQLNLHKEIVTSGQGTKITITTNNDLFFHIDDQDKVVFDKEDHDAVKVVYNQIPAGTLTLTTDAYTYYAISGGNYDSRTDELVCDINYKFMDGTWTATACSESGCQTSTISRPTGVDKSIYTGPLTLKAESPYVLDRDTTFSSDGVTTKVDIKYTLKNTKGSN